MGDEAVAHGDAVAGVWSVTTIALDAARPLGYVRRTVGVYPDASSAVDVVERNVGDIQEHRYTWAVVEFIWFGLYPSVANDDSSRWFEWSGLTGVYEELAVEPGGLLALRAEHHLGGSWHEIG